MAYFDDVKFTQKHRIPIGYKDKVVKYKYVMAIKLDLNADINGEFSLDFLNNLPSYYRVQIGDTFYQKRGAEFIYDYLNTSRDYRQKLEPLVYKEIWIWRDFT